MGFGTIGTVRQNLSSPASALHLVSLRNHVGVPSEGAEPFGGIGAPTATMPTTHSSATLNSSGYATANNPFPVARILRDQRRRDLLASIAEWERASGPDRTYWRRDARHRLREWRRLYRIPERAAFQQAVDRRAAQ